MICFTLVMCNQEKDYSDSRPQYICYYLNDCLESFIIYKEMYGGNRYKDQA